MNIIVSHVIRINETPDSPPFSGAENHLWFLLPELVKYGVDVELIVIYKNSGPLMEDTFKKLQEKGVKIILLPLAVNTNWFFSGFIPFQRLYNLVKVLNTRRERIIHIHLDYTSAPIAAWLAGCTKLVMSIHNDEEDLSKNAMRIWLYILDFIIKKYIAISERTRGYYIEVSGIKPNKIKLIYYGVEYKNSNLLQKELRNLHNIPNNKKVVGFVGRLTYQKNVELIIQAARHLPQVHFVIVGEGEQRESLQGQSSTLSNVQFLGHQSNGYEMISAFDIFCLPSRFEGLGLVLIEAMLQSVPIIGSRAGAIPEILKNGQYGTLFTSERIDDFINAIQYALANPEKVRLKAEQAKEFASVFFSIDKMTLDTINLYTEINYI